MYYKRKKYISVVREDGKINRIIIGKKENFQLEFYPKSIGFTIKYLTVGYNDYDLPLFIFHFIFGAFYLTLPWKHNLGKNYYDNAPTYGIYYHNKTFVLCHGEGTTFLPLPNDYIWIRTSLFLKDGTWEHETKGNQKSFYKQQWENKRWSINIPYKHRTRNEGNIDVLITCHIKEMEWRQKWLKWCKYGAKIKRTLDVDFSTEVGERRGSWKGGVLGTDFNIPKNGTYLDALKEMEERFDMYSIDYDRSRKITKIKKHIQ